MGRVSFQWRVFDFGSQLAAEARCELPPHVLYGRVAWVDTQAQVFYYLAFLD
jgi:hypothetical protein